jgi:hypothetical protein
MGELLTRLVKIGPYRDKINCFYLRIKKNKVNKEEFEECFMHLVNLEVEKHTHIEKKVDKSD